jgi:hypothetical protein
MSGSSVNSPVSQGINPILVSEYNITAEFAYLSNFLKQKDVIIDSKVYLDAIDLTENEFLVMFYNTSGLAFTINPSLYNFCPLSLIEQKYTTTNNMSVLYSLYDQLLKAYSTKHNRPENSIPNYVKINLQKELFKMQTLVNNYAYQSALSFDELISSLINSGKIEASIDSDNTVTVVFQLEYVYVSHLDTNVSVVFSYNVPLCGYIAKNIDPCPPYSKSEMIYESAQMAKDLKSAFKKLNKNDFSINDDSSNITFDTRVLLDDANLSDETGSDYDWNQ